MVTEADTAPEHPSPVYTQLAQEVGINSQLAREFKAGQQAIVDAPPDRPVRIDEFFPLRDDLDASLRNGELTYEEYLLKIDELSERSQQTSAYSDAQRTLDEFDHKARIETTIDANDVGAINQLLDKLTPAMPTVKTPAPFADYAANTRDAWRYVSPSETAAALEPKPFVDSYDIEDLRRDARSRTTLRTEAEYGQEKIPFKIPTDIIVNAAGFGSWLGRDSRFGEAGKGEKYIAFPDHQNRSFQDISINAIKAYASSPSRLPAVGSMEICIQPDGKAFASNGAGDSHRIAAAILRGQPYIEATYVNINLLRQNVL